METPSGWEVQRKETLEIPATWECYERQNSGIHYGAAWDRRVTLRHDDFRLTRKNWRVEKETYANGVTSLEYMTPEDEPLHYEIMFDKEGRRFSYNQALPLGYSGVSLVLREDGTIDFGPYTPRKIGGVGLYWDANDFMSSFQKFLEFTSDPNFNGPLPRQTLPQLREALKQGALGWKKEIENVMPRDKTTGLEAGQWDVYERIFQKRAAFPERA